MRRLLLALVLLSLFGVERSADACGGAVYDDDGSALNRARHALERGDYPLARRLAFDAVFAAPNEQSAARARRVLTMAQVRDVDTSEADLRKALGRLAVVRNDKPVHDVQSATDLGEALARFPEHASEARAILEPLAGKDLIGSPATYVALARVTNKPSTRVDALQRCSALVDDNPDYQISCRVGFVEAAFLPARHKETGILAIVSLLGSVACFSVLVGLVRSWRRRRLLVAFD